MSDQQQTGASPSSELVEEVAERLEELGAPEMARRLREELVRVEPGDVLEGYCHGCFGRSYGDKVVEAVGRDWVVCREVSEGELVLLASGADVHSDLRDCVRPGS